MATSAMKPSAGVSHLDKYNHYRDMMSFPAPTTKPVCPKYQRGECDGSRCPYFHPKKLAADKPTRPAPREAPRKTAPTPTKQPGVPTPDAAKPLAELNPKTSTPKSPQPPKNDKKNEKKPSTPVVVLERPEQKPAPANSRLVKSQTPQNPAVSTHAPRQPKPSPLASGSQTKALASNCDNPVVSHRKSSSNTSTPVMTRLQTGALRSTAISAIIQVDAEPAPPQPISSSSSASGTSPRKRNNYGRKKKQVQTSENSTTETSPPPETVSSEQDSVPEQPPVQCDLKDVIPSKRYICRNYLHKTCSQRPCPYYHDPFLANEPPLCRNLYVGPCTKNVCHFYHPEPTRYRMVCVNFLKSRCHDQRCRRFHFRLPVAETAPVKGEPSTLPLESKTGHTVYTNRGGATRQHISPPTSQSLSSSTSSTHGEDVGLRQTLCPAWNDGFCPKGRDCEMLHLHRDERWQMEATQAAATTTDRLIFDNTKVTFGAGCEIKQVITALDSCRVLISNLPARTTRGTLEDFLIRKGSNREAFSILVLRMSMDRDTQEASVIFNDIRDAKMVVEALDGNEYDDEILRLELTPALKPGQMDDFKYDRSFYLEVSLNAPSMRVQAIYPTVEDAIKKAKDLNGGKCWGRTLRVTVARQPRPDEKWTYIKNSIVIDNVDVNTPAAEIQKFANPFSVKTFGHRWFKVDTALHRLENHMRTIGGLKPGDFEVVKNSWKGTIFVRARFDVWEKADEVWQSLQETELEFLPRGHARSFLAFPHQYSLHVPVEHYDAQKEIYDRLEHQHGRNRTAHIVATRFRPLSLIQVVGVDKKAVGALKLKVEKIAQGQVVGVWDRFFLDWQGDAFFGRLLRQFGAYVRPDRTKQVLRVYGSDTAVNHARREIKEQMKTLAALDYQMTIEEHWIGFFIVKGMEILGDMLGEENVWLHTTSKPYFVSVRGGNDAEHALQKLVREASRAPLRPRVRDWSQTCSLCFAEPMQRFPLVCQHIYCTGCLKHMVISATDGNNVIRCIGDEGRCKTPVPLPVIERFIPPVRLTQIFENSFRVYLERHPNEYRFCQTPDCTQIYRVSKEDSAVIQCPACLIETCSHCHRPPHRGLTCEENTLIGSKNGQELLVERWAKGHSNVKKCPDCGIFIEKVDGCNHIHCRCGGHVCWICAKTFNDGIYDHLLTVHGGPYDADH